MKIAILTCKVAVSMKISQNKIISCKNTNFSILTWNEKNCQNLKVNHNVAAFFPMVNIWNNKTMLQ